jgi:glycosyltransferase involved in cell wall biosynthesis
MSEISNASVVIPAYNSAGTIDRAVRAAADQAGVVEVIVSDDGSTDPTAEAASEAGATVLRLPHGGQSVARNAGIERAEAPVVVFCDADDWLAPGAVGAMLGAFSTDVGVVAGRVEVVGESKPRWWPPEEIVGDLDVAAFLHSNWIGGCTAAMRRDLARELGGFDPNLAHTMDYNLWIRAAARSRVVMLPTVVGYVDRSRPSFSSDRVGALKDRLVMLERLAPEIASFADVAAARSRTASDLSRMVRSPLERWRWRRRAARWASG